YTLCHALVRQHGAADDIAHRVDSGQAGAVLLVNGNIALVVETDLGAFRAQAIRIGTPANGDDKLVESRLMLLAAKFVRNLDLILACFGTGNARAKLDIEALFLEGLGCLGGHLAISRRHELVNRFQQHDVAAESRPHAAQLDADDAGADDTEPLGYGVELQRAPRINDTIAIKWRNAKLHRGGTAGNDDVFSLERFLFTIVAGEQDFAGVDHLATAHQRRNAVGLEQRL